MHPFFVGIHGQQLPPVDRRNLTHPHVRYAEHGNPVLPPGYAGQSDRKEGPWKCGHKNEEEANAVL